MSLETSSSVRSYLVRPLEAELVGLYTDRELNATFAAEDAAGAGLGLDDE